MNEFHTHNTCRTSELQFEFRNHKSNFPSYFPHNHTQQKTNIKSSLPSYFPTSTQQNSKTPMSNPAYQAITQQAAHSETLNV
jgi:hypothetical protein